MSESSAAMLNNATIEKAERNEISNCTRDMFKFVQNNYNLNNMEEIPDPIRQLIKVVPHFLAEVRKNDQSGSTVSETTGPDGSDETVSTHYTPHSSNLELVDISDMVPANPSSLPVITIADLYTCSMLKCLAGYPLYEPEPFSELSMEYLHHGVNIGDVGFVREDGAFDFLFNVCPSQNGLINPPILPDGFSLEASECSVTRTMRPLLRDTHLFKHPVTRTSSGEYICGGPEGAVLELPEGAIRDEAINRLPFENLAAYYGVEWYKYTMSRGRSIPNGSLYLITSFTKCAQWGIAVFDQPCALGQGLKFDSETSFPFSFWKSTSKYRWNGPNTSNTKVANPNQGNALNQCVFLRGYKIMIRQDIFDNLRKDLRGSYTPMSSSSPQAGSTSLIFTRQKASRIRGGGGTDPSSTRLTGESPTIKTEPDEVVLHPNFNSSLIHPSDLVNVALLSQNPDAKVAQTHDDVWCDLLREEFNYTTLNKIAKSYASTVDGYGCVSLEKVSSSSNILNPSNHPVRRTEITAMQKPIHEARDEHNLDISILTQGSTTLRLVDHSPGAGDEGTPGILVPSQGPSRLMDGDVGQRREEEKGKANWERVQLMPKKQEEDMLGLHPPADLADMRPSHIRSRVSVVCAECKRLKLKCDRRNPCGSCIKRDTVSRCIYHPAVAEKIDLHSLNNRLIQVMAILSSITSDQALPAFQSSYPQIQPNTIPSQEQLVSLQEEHWGQLKGELMRQDENLKEREEELRPPVNISDVQHSQIRPRITVVCAECKRLKLKCDRHSPCGSCAKRDVVSRCIYSPAAAEKVDLHSIYNSLIQVEATLSSITSGQAPPVFQGSYPQIQLNTVPRQEPLALLQERKQDDSPKKREAVLGLRPSFDISDVRHGPIRSRITVVCAECKRLKLKCDRRSPCGSCTKRDAVSRCIYSSAGAEKVDLHSIYNRLIQVETTLSSIISGQALPMFQSSNLHSQSQQSSYLMSNLASTATSLEVLDQQESRTAYQDRTKDHKNLWESASAMLQGDQNLDISDYPLFPDSIVKEVELEGMEGIEELGNLEGMEGIEELENLEGMQNFGYYPFGPDFMNLE